MLLSFFLVVASSLESFHYYFLFFVATQGQSYLSVSLYDSNNLPPSKALTKIDQIMIHQISS